MYGNCAVSLTCFFQAANDRSNAPSRESQQANTDNNETDTRLTQQANNNKTYVPKFSNTIQAQNKELFDDLLRGIHDDED